MKNKEKFLLNGAMLAATSILIRFIALGFNVYLTGKIGSAGIGLITLVNSVYTFAVTFATSGIKLASMRLCSRAIGMGSNISLRSAMKKSIVYSLSFGVAAMVLLFSFAKPIGVYLLDDIRTVSCLRLLSPTLPCIAVGAALSGYFNAVRRVYKNAISTMLEQAVKISITVSALRILLPKGIEYSCIAVICGGALAEAASFLFSYIMYRIDLHSHISKDGKLADNITKKLLSTALPIALTQYVRSGLLTVEHMLIPKGLRKYGLSTAAALSGYGTVQAMALPVVIFPLAILQSFTVLLVPDISEAGAREDKFYIKRAVNKVLCGTLIFAVGTSALLFAFSSDLGMTIYNSPDASRYIKYLAILVPVMYFDTAVDSMLQGLGEQVYSMKVNIIDAALSALLVYIILPHSGIDGYIGIIFFCEILNLSLSYLKLAKIISPTVKLLRNLALPLFCAVGAVSSSRLLFALLRNFNYYGILPLCIKIALSLILYCIYLALLTNTKPGLNGGGKLCLQR